MKLPFEPNLDFQLRNGLPPSSSLASGDFTVEMETGTGKTYPLCQCEGRHLPLRIQVVSLSVEKNCMACPALVPAGWDR